MKIIFFKKITFYLSSPFLTCFIFILFLYDSEVDHNCEAPLGMNFEIKIAVKIAYRISVLNRRNLGLVSWKSKIEADPIQPKRSPADSSLPILQPA